MAFAGEPLILTHSQSGEIVVDVADLASLKEKAVIRVLHVDDDPSVQELTKLMLLDLNSDFEIDWACCVDEAFKKLSAGQYDVVVSDYEMPQKDGLHFLKELRNSKNEIPFILFTGKGREEVAIKTLNLGADGYHNKQGSPETVYGELSYSIVIAVDRKKAKSALAESERRYHALMEQASDAIFIHDTQGRILFANQKACKNLGYTKEEFTKMTIADIDNDAVETGKQILWSKVVAGQSFIFESNQKCKDGSILPVEVSLGPTTDGKTTLIIGLIRDISERKKAELELKKSNEIIEKLGEGIDAGLAIIDRDYHIVWANKRLIDLGVAPNKKCYETFNKLGVVCPDCGVERIFQQDASLDVHEYKTVNSKGETVWLELRVTPLKDPNGITIGALELAIPITERKQAETAVKESEEKYRSLFESTQDGIVISDAQGIVQSANQAAATMFGYLNAEEMVNVAAQTLYADPQDRKVLFEVLAAKGSVKDYELKHKRKDGSTFDGRVSVVMRRDVHGNVLQSEAILRDITERKQTKEELYRSEERFRQLSENGAEWIWEVDSSGLYTYSSSVVEKLLGFKPEELVGKKYFFDLFPVDEREELKKAAFAAFASKSTFNGFVNRNVHKNGDIVWLSTGGVPILNQKGDLLGYRGLDIDITKRKKNEDALRQERAMLESVTKNIGAGLVMISKDYKILWMNNFLKQFTGASEGNHCYSSFNTCTTICPDCGPKKIFEGAQFDSREYFNQTEFNKDHPVWFELIATPIKDKEGNVVAALELTVNITEKKEAEKKQQESNDKIKNMNEKLLVLGSLTRHDVGNKMMAAKSNLYLLRKKIGDNTDLTKYLDSIDSALVSSDRIFEFSRLYEKIGVEKPSKENVFESFNQAIALMKKNLGTIKVVNECEDLVVVADSLLKQLFYNFIDNSLKHGEKVTQIQLHYTKGVDGLKLFYEDNGVGVSKANKLRLFEAGFSTGKSTGLGLYLVKKMMDVYGWTIAEEGEEGKGARFVITIQKPKEQDGNFGINK